MLIDIQVNDIHVPYIWVECTFQLISPITVLFENVDMLLEIPLFEIVGHHILFGLTSCGNFYTYIMFQKYSEIV